MTARLLAGPALALGAEPLAAHRARLGELPGPAQRADIITAIEAAGLLGRGGAGFPVARKWASVAGRSKGNAVILANGAEGEPMSLKDRVLMSTRPHLVLDGVELAAEAVRAKKAVLYIGAEHIAARVAMQQAVRERSSRLDLRIVTPPVSYVAGEESAAVRFVNRSDARPVTVPPRPFEKGIDGKPTLVQNVESLAQVALIARYGAAWYREAGRAETRGTTLVTVSGVATPGVMEVELGSTIADIAGWTGFADAPGSPVLLGGYFGSWVAGSEAWKTPLDPALLRARGVSLGAGVMGFIGGRACGVAATARIMDYMAGSSAAQCGPCVYGLRAVADAAARLATFSGAPDDLRRLRGWTESIPGRGACRLPDGTMGLLRSALTVFEGDWSAHQFQRRCAAGLGAGVGVRA